MASTFLLQLDVDAPPHCLLHPSLGISVHPIRHLVIARPGSFTLGIHPVQATIEVNGQKQSCLRRQHEGVGAEVSAVSGGDLDILSLREPSRAHGHGRRRPHPNPQYLDTLWQICKPCTLTQGRASE